MERLKGLALRLLAALPPEPNGLSIHELADGLLGGRDPKRRGMIRAALEEIRGALGNLYERTGDVPEFGRYGVTLYGVPGHKVPGVKTFLARRHACA